MKKLNALLFCAVAAPAYVLVPGNVFAADDKDSTKTYENAGESSMETGQRETEQFGSGQQDPGMDGTAQGSTSRTQDGPGKMDLRKHESQNMGQTDKRGMSGDAEAAFHADDLIGKDVRNRIDDEEIGSITDLAIGEDGQIVSVIVSVGGFLGVGEKSVAISWGEVERQLGADGDYVITVDRNQQSLNDAPAYDRSSVQDNSSN